MQTFNQILSVLIFQVLRTRCSMSLFHYRRLVEEGPGGDRPCNILEMYYWPLNYDIVNWIGENVVSRIY